MPAVCSADPSGTCWESAEASLDGFPVLAAGSLPLRFRIAGSLSLRLAPARPLSGLTLCGLFLCGSLFLRLLLDTLQQEIACLKRKYPFQEYLFKYLNRNVIGATIEGSNSVSGIKHLLYRFTDTLLTNRKAISFSQPCQFRYLHLGCGW